VLCFGADLKGRIRVAPLSRPSPRDAQHLGIAVDSDDFPIATDFFCCEYAYIADASADIQHTHARTDTSCIEQPGRDRLDDL
jgi:hypothetical protein